MIVQNIKEQDSMHVIHPNVIRYLLEADNQIKDKDTRLSIIKCLSELSIVDNSVGHTLIDCLHSIFSKELFAFKSKINVFFINLPYSAKLDQFTRLKTSVSIQLTLEDTKDVVTLENRIFTKDELSVENTEEILDKTDNTENTPTVCIASMLFLRSAVALEYLCDFSVKYGVNLSLLADNFVKTTETHFGANLKNIENIPKLVDFATSAVAFLGIVKSNYVPNFINLALVQLKANDIHNKNKLLYILVQTKTSFTKAITGNSDLLSSVNDLFIEDDLKAIFLEVLMISKVSDAHFDKLLVTIFKSMSPKTTKLELLDQLVDRHIYLLNQSPSYVRMQYAFNICGKLIYFVHHSK